MEMICIVGPTATGKTRLSVALAQKLGTTVCVVSGIHFDGASKQDIAEIVNSTNKMLAQLLEHFN